MLISVFKPLLETLFLRAARPKMRKRCRPSGREQVVGETEPVSGWIWYIA